MDGVLADFFETGKLIGKDWRKITDIDPYKRFVTQMIFGSNYL